VDPQHNSGAADGFTIRDLARRWRVGTGKVRQFLYRGELVGVNVAADPLGRPQWRITAESVEQFEKRRRSGPPPESSRQRQRRLRRVEEADFFPD
jgi:hypothetical protein